MKAGLNKTALTIRDDVDERYREALETLLSHSVKREEVPEETLQEARDIVLEYQEEYDV